MVYIRIAFTDQPGCPVMLNGASPDYLCGRTLHSCDPSIDRFGVCILHSNDPLKFEPGSDAAKKLSEQFEETLASAGEGLANFNYAIFPELSIENRTLEPECFFHSATFRGNLWFDDVTFKRLVSFQSAEIAGNLTMRSGVVFESQEGPSSLPADSIFRQWSSPFNECGLSFDGARIGGDLSFSGRVNGSSIFTNMQVSGETWLTLHSFRSALNFSGSKFSGQLRFWNTSESKNLFAVDFSSTEISALDLSSSRFLSSCFYRSRFSQPVDLSDCSLGQADFRFARFAGEATFGAATFADSDGRPSPLFVGCIFEEPSSVNFYKCDLRRALFLNCDISDVNFTSCRWPTREHTECRKVFDEETMLDPNRVNPVALYNQNRDFELLSQLYQRLKKNSDNHLNYWLGDDFHYGEMEMIRLAPPRDGRFLNFRKKCKEHFSLVALYRYASAYGNSYRRPALLLVLASLLFGLLYPMFGLRGAVDAESAGLTYTSVWEKEDGLTRNLMIEAQLLGAGVMSCLDIATFQKTSDFVPVYPAGRALSVLQALITATLFALFLLAIRRQFRR